MWDAHGPVAGSGNHPSRIDSGEKHQTSHASRLVLQLPRRLERTITQFHREIDEEFRVVATGGLSRVFADDTDMIDIYDPDLIFKGMLHIYERNIRQ